MSTTRIPVKFNRVAAAFNEAARVRRLCESSGSEHWTGSSTDLSELVNSFIEREYEGEGDHDGQGQSGKELDCDESSDSSWSDSETKDMLENLLGCNKLNNDDGCPHVKRKIRFVTERACQILNGERSLQGFKRRLMTHLRERGFDAGLCKSRWEKFGRHPAGSYEYVDVNVGGSRYIVEVFLAGEFEIARPTSRYSSLLDVFPQIFIGKPEELKKVVRLMSTAIRESMKSMDMHVAPWRRNGYMQAKWFGPYKRTTNETPSKEAALRREGLGAMRSVGFEALPTVPYFCRHDFARRVVGLKVSHLSAEFNVNGNGIGMQLWR